MQSSVFRYFCKFIAVGLGCFNQLPAFLPMAWPHNKEWSHIKGVPVVEWSGVLVLLPSGPKGQHFESHLLTLFLGKFLKKKRKKHRNKMLR